MCQIKIMQIFQNYYVTFKLKYKSYYTQDVMTKQKNTRSKPFEYELYIYISIFIIYGSSRMR